MYTYVAASRRRCLFACGTAFSLLLLALVFVSGCSDDSVSPGGTGPAT
ncbi:MAG: hypothetical protein H6Q78_1403, partial [Candidatus Krumholzibacteriota bacterium]|nr:hypothetical protein [Candidatus Krumholzibacteriota bacterium]